MAHAKQASKRKTRRTTLPVVGAAGVSLAVAGGASATAPADAPAQDTSQRPAVFLGEEELLDVSLATFYVFDKEYTAPGEILQVAQRGCGGCRGCAARGCAGCAARGCAGCAARGCAVRGCAVGVVGCRGCAVGCRGCAVRACGGCGCGACGGCGCGICWIWTPWGWIPAC
jgi:hypothetical protein